MLEDSHLDRLQLKRNLKAEALRLGFHAVGVARAERLDEEALRLTEWLHSEKHGSMAWMEGHFEKRVDPRLLVPGARSIVSVLENYYQPVVPADSDGIGKISRYAWGDDYHQVMRDRLHELFAWLDEQVGGVSGRVFVDSAPVMDKAWAARAGLGWLGKHTNLINQQIGSWFFIGEVIVDIDLEPDRPVADLCGSCTRCLDACPTDALVEPYVLDATKCISYLTIEHREDDISSELQSEMENWVFGCDICQDVCPWNKFARPTGRAEYAPRPGTLDTKLETWDRLSDAEFSVRFRNSPVKRTKFHGFKRNVRIARSNETAVPPATTSQEEGEPET